MFKSMNTLLPDDGTIEILNADFSKNPQLEMLEMLANLMDNAFQIPHTNIRFGIDSFIGLIPILGDTVSAGISLFLISSARAMGIPKHKIWLMRFNIFMDWLIGCIPFIGDAFDVAWKANTRNIKIIRVHIEKQNEVLDGEIL